MDSFFPLPTSDPTTIYRYRDGLYAVDMLTTALAHLDFFTWLDGHPSNLQTICESFHIHERPADVMLTLFVSMGLIETKDAKFHLSTLAREHLVKGSSWNITPYFASLKDRPVCRDLITVLRTGKPASWGSFDHEKAWAKAMEEDAFASQFTAAMDCRGSYLAPALAEKLDCRDLNHLLDVAGGSGIYACAFADRHPQLKATVLERPPVDRIAREKIRSRGFAERVVVHVADMFKDPFPSGCDVHLFSNVLHDWDVPRVRQLLAKSFEALLPGGLLIIHGAHINASKTGPLPVAAYSTLLMTITEGKCYSQGEMRDMLLEAGFGNFSFVPSVADRSVITARKGTRDGLPSNPIEAH